MRVGTLTRDIVICQNPMGVPAGRGRHWRFALTGALQIGSPRKLYVLY